MKKGFSLLFLFVLIFTGCNQQAAEETQAPEPHKVTIDVAETDANSIPERLKLVSSRKVKNVIFIIGDGTGISQLASGQLNLVGKDGLLHIQTMPVTGIVRTHSSNSLITDSASGVKGLSAKSKFAPA